MPLAFVLPAIGGLRRPRCHSRGGPHLPLGPLTDFSRQYREADQMVLVAPAGRDADPGFGMGFQWRQIPQPILGR